MVEGDSGMTVSIAHTRSLDQKRCTIDCFACQIEVTIKKAVKEEHERMMGLGSNAVELAVAVEKERCARIVEDDGYNILQGQADGNIAMMCIAEEIRK